MTLLINFINLTLNVAIDTNLSLSIIESKKKFNVALINYKRLSLYIQRQTNKILRLFKDFVKIYIDNIIIHSRTLKKYLIYLRQLFNFFCNKRVNLITFKLYLKYSLIILLNQQINSLKITIIEKKKKYYYRVIVFNQLKKVKKFFNLID